LFILFRALGVITDKDICNHVVLDVSNKNNKKLLADLHGAIEDATEYATQDECIDYITTHVMYTPINVDVEKGKAKKREFAINVLNTDLFPHCHNKTQKRYFLGYMVNKLLQCRNGWIPIDDRDSYLNKRIDLTGVLLNNLFRNYFNKLVKDMQKHVIREINNGSWRSTDDYMRIMNKTNIYKIIKSTTIENGLKRALATGDFGIKHANSNKVGVAQVLSRFTYASSLSHQRRINTPMDKSGKLIPPRKLHNSSWGFLCPAETPEGQSVGVVKNISYMTHITTPSYTTPLYDYVKEYIIPIVDGEVEADAGDTSPVFITETFANGVKVFVNGTWVGNAKEPVALYNLLNWQKGKGIINVYTSVVFKYK
ncbi:MAG: hypothetical protein QF535_06625, partial [Anaerolineales bacterium]|nr:hypothetical protein [Anaerolineales bacterium]